MVGWWAVQKETRWAAWMAMKSVEMKVGDLVR